MAPLKETELFFHGWEGPQWEKLRCQTFWGLASNTNPDVTLTNIKYVIIYTRYVSYMYLIFTDPGTIPIQSSQQTYK